MKGSNILGCQDPNLRQIKEELATKIDEANKALEILDRAITREDEKHETSSD
tara:strand:+ start:1172 stop:1327 length:156 start_codon:yes stop_codon:yes gene_type:complete